MTFQEIHFVDGPEFRVETIKEHVARTEELKACYDRIARLEADLTEVLEYFQDKYDVVDGSYGEPSPNKEMQLGTMLEETLHGRPF